MKTITLSLDDPRRAYLLRRANQLEGQINVIALPSRQMDIICPFEILRALIRTGSVDFFELKTVLIQKYNYRRENFSEDKYSEAFIKLLGEINPQKETEETVLVSTT